MGSVLGKPSDCLPEAHTSASSALKSLATADKVPRKGWSRVLSPKSRDCRFPAFFPKGTGLAAGGSVGEQPQDCFNAVETKLEIDLSNNR